MSAIEALLRDAFEADAQTVREQDVPPLAAPRGRSAGRGAWLRTSRTRVAVPLAAAAAVAAIALIGGLVVPKLIGGSGAAGQSMSADTRGALFGAQPASPQPPYFVGPYNGAGPATYLGIYSARTGQLIDHIDSPGRNLTFTTSAPTADPLSFVVAAQPRSGSCTTWLFRLTLTARGHVASLIPLRVPHLPGQILPPSGLTASASGQSIAYTASGCGQRHGWLGVIDVATGKVRTWPASAESLWSLSMSADGTLVLFANSTIYGGDGSIQVLRADAQPGPLAQRARVVIPGSAGIGANGSVAITPDARAVLACTETGSGSGSRTASLGAWTVATGSPLGTVHTWPNVDVAPCLVSAVPAGRYLMISDITNRGIGTRLDLVTGRAWQVNGSGQNPPSGISW